MSVPASQMWTVATYVLKQRLRGRKRYPLVLMLEPLFRCNLACAGCGKIQYPAQILRKHLTVEQCLGAVEECGAPIVSVPGGEPLMYPEIGRLVEELVRRRKYVYLCTNALLLKEKLEAGLFTPSKYLTFNLTITALVAEVTLFWAGVGAHLPLAAVVVSCVASSSSVAERAPYAGEPA